jgi:26S proteasome regulatory subunit N5
MTIKTLSSRRSQKSKAIAAIVEKAMPWAIISSDGPVVAVVPNSAKLVETLRDITDGKLFLEAERARLTRALAKIKEDAGLISEAADCLQEVHVETYGSLSKREKIEFILEQMRLTLAKQDYVRASIVSNKVNRAVLSEEGMETLKIKFFKLMTEYHHLHTKDTFELAKDYHQMYLTLVAMDEKATASTKNDEKAATAMTNDEKPALHPDDNWIVALQTTVLFLALSPYSMEQQDMLNRVQVNPNLGKKNNEAFKATVEMLLKKEIAPYPLPHQEQLESLKAFHIGQQQDSTSQASDYWRTMLHKRINQHNIRVASQYYRRIRGTRLAELIGLSPAELEVEISSMVSDGSVYAKIDRPNDIIRFATTKTPEVILTDWSNDISELLDLVEKTTHLIHKEMTAQ